MAEHVREQILTAINTKLDALKPATVKTVHRARVYQENEADLDSLNIVWGPDDPVDDEDEEAEDVFVVRLLLVTIEVRVRETSDVDKRLIAVETEVVKALAADFTLGVSGVHNSWFASPEPPEPSAEGDQKLGQLDLPFFVRYQHRRLDPTLGV